MTDTGTTDAPQETNDTPDTRTGDDEVDRLRSELVKARKWEDRAKANADAAKRLAELEAASASDLDRAVKAARDEGRTEVLSAVNKKLITSEARAVAAELRFKNPALAIKAVDLSAVTVDDDGEVDSDALRTALKALASDEPYLVSDGRPKGDADQGTRGAPATGADMNTLIRQAAGRG